MISQTAEHQNVRIAGMTGIARTVQGGITRIP